MSKLGVPYLPCSLVWTKISLDKHSSVYPTYLPNKFGHFGIKVCSVSNFPNFVRNLIKHIFLKFDQKADIFAIFEISKNFQKFRFFQPFRIFLILFFYFLQLDIHFNTGIKELESNTQRCMFQGGVFHPPTHLPQHSGNRYAVGNRFKARQVSQVSQAS